MEPVTVTGTYSADDLVGARLHMARRNPVLRMIRFGPLFITGLMAIFFVASGRITSGRGIGLVVFCCATIVILSLVFSRFISRPIQRFLMRRQIKSSPLLSEIKTFRFDLAGLHWEQESSKGHLDWIGVLSAEENSSGLFLFTGRNFAHFIPRRFFESPEDLARLREIIAAALPGITRLLSK